MIPKDPNNNSQQKGLPRSRILRGRERFDKLFSCGRVIYGNQIMLRYYLNDGISTYYMAFIVAKRLGKAVQRNKIKRRMREVYRRNLKLLDSLYKSNGNPGFYGALMAKTINLSFTQAENDVITLLEKLKKKILLNSKPRVE